MPSFRSHCNILVRGYRGGTVVRHQETDQFPRKVSWRSRSEESIVAEMCAFSGPESRHVCSSVELYVYSYNMYKISNLKFVLLLLTRFSSKGRRVTSIRYGPSGMCRSNRLLQPISKPLVSLVIVSYDVFHFPRQQPTFTPLYFCCHCLPQRHPKLSWLLHD